MATILNTGFKLPTSVISNGQVTGNPWSNPENLLLVDNLLSESNSGAGVASDVILGNYNFDLPQNAVVVGIELMLVAKRGAQTSPVITLTPYAVDNTSGQDVFYPYETPFEDLTPDLDTYILGSQNYQFATQFSVDQLNNLKFQLVSNGDVYTDCLLANAYYYIPDSETPVPENQAGCDDCDSLLQVQPVYLNVPFLIGETKFYVKPNSFTYADGTPVQPGDTGSCGGTVNFVFDEGLKRAQGSNFEENINLPYDPEDPNTATWTVLSDGVIEFDIKTIQNRGLSFHGAPTHSPDRMSDHDANSKVIISNNAPWGYTLLKRCHIGVLVSEPIETYSDGALVLKPTVKYNFKGAGKSVSVNPGDFEMVDVLIPGAGGTIPPQLVSTTSGTSGSTQVPSLSADILISGVDRGVVIQVSTEQSKTITGITVGGVAATQVTTISDAGSNIRNEIWICVNPPLGTQPIVVTMSAAAYITFGAECFSGIDTTDPTGATQTATATDNNPTLSLNTTRDYSLVVDSLATAQTPILYIPGAGQSTNWAVVANSATRQGGSSTESAGTSPDAITMDYSITQSTKWLYAAVELKGIVTTSPSDGKVKVSTADLVADFLTDKLQLTPGTGVGSIVKTIINPGANEILRFTINVTGGGGSGALFIDQTPDNGNYGLLAGAVDGVNKTFTVSEGEYMSGKLAVYLNGLVQLQGASDDFQELVPGSGTFEFNTAPLAGDIITAMYVTSETVVDTYKVKATSADTTPDYLENKFEVTSDDNSVDVTTTIENPGANEKVKIDLSVQTGGNTSLLTSNQYLPVAASDVTGNFGSSDTPRSDIFTDTGTSRIYVPLSNGFTVRVFKNDYGSFYEETTITVTAADLSLTTATSLDQIAWCKDDTYLYALVRYRKSTATSYTRIDVVRMALDGTSKVATNIYAGALSGGDRIEWSSTNNLGAVVVGSSFFTLWQTGAGTNQMREYTISGTTYTLANTYTQTGSIGVEDTFELSYDSTTLRFYMFGGNSGGGSSHESFQKWVISGSNFTNDGGLITIDGLQYMATESDGSYSMASIGSFSASSYVVYTLNVMSNVDGGSSTNRHSFWLQGLTLPKQ